MYALHDSLACRAHNKVLLAGIQIKNATRSIKTYKHLEPPPPSILPLPRSLNTERKTSSKPQTDSSCAGPSPTLTLPPVIHTDFIQDQISPGAERSIQYLVLQFCILIFTVLTVQSQGSKNESDQEFISKRQ